MGKRKIILIATVSSLLLLSQKVFAMHISEGLLPLKWAGLWYLIALPFLIRGVIDIKKREMLVPSFKILLSMISAVVFIISCMPVPVPTAGTCSHPCGTGISGILLGPVMSIFASSIALLIQALFLAHGGITTWGANIVSMGIVGSFAGYFVFKILRKFKVSLFVSGFIAGMLADWLVYTTTSFELALAFHGEKSFLSLFAALLIAFVPTQLPLGIFEGCLTGGMLVFIARQRPDILVSLGILDSMKNYSFVEKKYDIASQTAISKGILIFVLSSFLFLGSINLFAGNGTKWTGVDETVVEKVAQEHGRASVSSWFNADQGDLLLFLFLLAGTVGGFILGYNWRKLFVEKVDLKNVK